MSAKNNNESGKPVSLHPLTFEEAIQALANPTHADSEAEGSDSTKEAAPESDSSEPRTSLRRSSDIMH